jgi:hypothetical protein
LKLDELTNKFVHPRLRKFYLKKFKTTQSKPFPSACFRNGVQEAGILQKKETEMLVLFCKKTKKKLAKNFEILKITFEMASKKLGPTKERNKMLINKRFVKKNTK